MYLLYLFTVLQGEFNKRYKRHGEGEFRYQSGDVYKGSYKNSKKHGYGVYTFKLVIVTIQERVRRERGRSKQSSPKIPKIQLEGEGGEGGEGEEEERKEEGKEEKEGEQDSVVVENMDDELSYGGEGKEEGNEEDKEESKEENKTESPRSKPEDSPRYSYEEREAQVRVIYDGQWMDDKPHGHGSILQERDGVLAGEFSGYFEHGARGKGVYKVALVAP